MKKLLAAALAACTIIGSFASLSMAYSTITGFGYSNRYNGSYYYDLGWGTVYVSKNDSASVRVRLKKNGTWQASKTTTAKGYSTGGTSTCYSNTIQGTGANGVNVKIL